MKITTQLALFVAVSCVSLQASAFWSDELTTHAWDNYQTPNQSTFDGSAVSGADCGGNGWNRGFKVPGKRAGGWSESRFMNTQAFGFFQSLAGDVGKACPKTFNEFAYNHQHGTTSGRIATYKGVVYGVYDSLAGYYYANKIKLLRDPSARLLMPESSARAGSERRYSLVDLARNPRNYVDVNPGSPTFGVFPGVDCRDYNPLGVGIDPQWSLRSGADQEGTKCAPPAVIQTFDPDIVVREASAATPDAAAFVTWTERYVEGSAVFMGQRYKGFDPAHPMAQTGEPNERPLAVHVERISPDDMARGVGLTTPLSSGEQGLNLTTTHSAVSPRITARNMLGVYYPVVAWAELPFHETTTENGARYQEPYQEGPLLVKGRDGFSQPDDPNGWYWMTEGQSLGNVCFPIRVSSGRATGRKSVFTGTHDIAVTRNAGSTDESPIIVHTVRNGNACELRVHQWGNNGWTSLGGDLRADASASPSEPRITVHDNVPYITWIEQGAGGFMLRVKKYNPALGSWSDLGLGGWSGGATEFVRGPAIAVTSLGGVSTDTDDGAIVYVSASVRAPAGSPMGAGVDTMWVSRCVVQKSATGFECATPPSRYTDPKYLFEGGAAMYNRDTVLGYTTGMRQNGRVLDNDPLEKPHAIALAPDFQLRFPGATDLVAIAGSEAGSPRSMYASWEGPVQDHRDFDQGFYVKQDEPGAAAGALVAAGAGFTAYYPGKGTLLYSWGNNASGQFGTASPTSSAAPVAVTLPAPLAKLVAFGSTVAALTTEGKLYLWGANAGGQLCNGTTTATSVPQLAAGTYADVALGSDFVLALRASDGVVLSCGQNASGQLATLNTTASLSWRTVQTRDTPTGTPYALAAISVHAGAKHACALTATRNARCWGYNVQGQTGGWDTSPAVTYARAVYGTTRFVSLSLGGYHAAGLSYVSGTNYQLFTWGRNADGQLGRGSMAPNYAYTDANVPTYVHLFSSERPQIMTSSEATYIWFGGNTGEVQAVGRNDFGQLGRGTFNVSSPTWTSIYVGANPNYLRMFAGPSANHIYVTTHLAKERVAQTPFCWGLNAQLQCRPTTGNIAAPVAVTPVVVVTDGVLMTSQLQGRITTTFTGLHASGAKVVLAVQGSSPGSAAQVMGSIESIDGNFVSAPVPAGTYVARVIDETTGEVLKESAPIVVKQTWTMSASVGTNITVSWTGISALSGDYVALASADAAVGHESHVSAAVSGSSKTFLRNQPHNAVGNGDLPDGNYVARYFRADGSLVAWSAPFAFGNPTAAASITVAVANDAHYTTTVTLDNVPSKAVSWVGISATNAFAAQAFQSYAYLNQSSDKKIFVDLLPGLHVARLYDWDGSVIATSAPFTIPCRSGAHCIDESEGTSIATSLSTYATAQPVDVHFTGVPYAVNDYVTIATPDSPPEATTSCDDGAGTTLEACALYVGSFRSFGVGAYGYQSQTHPSLPVTGLLPGTYVPRYFDGLGSLLAEGAPFQVE